MGVEFGDEIAQGGEGVVVGVEWGFGAAVGGVVAVAVEGGFAQEVWTRAGEDF